MFAYCQNNPLNLHDPSGKFPLIIIPVIFGFAAFLSGCANSPNDAKKAYNVERDIKNETYSKCYNCLGNVISKRIIMNPVGYKPGMSVEKTFEGFKKIVGAKNVRILNGIYSPINNDENMGALKVGQEDYHFMVRVNDIWWSKPGSIDKIEENIEPWKVDAPVWTPGYDYNGNALPGVTYDSDTIYFAIRKDWYK